MTRHDADPQTGQRMVFQLLCSPEEAKILQVEQKVLRSRKEESEEKRMDGDIAGAQGGLGMMSAFLQAQGWPGNLWSGRGRGRGLAMSGRCYICGDGSHYQWDSPMKG